MIDAGSPNPYAPPSSWQKVDGAEALRFSNQVDIVSSVVTIVAALLAIAVVRGLARRQDERQRVLAGGDRP